MKTELAKQHMVMLTSLHLLEGPLEEQAPFLQTCWWCQCTLPTFHCFYHKHTITYAMTATACARCAWVAGLGRARLGVLRQKPTWKGCGAGAVSSCCTCWTGPGVGAAPSRSCQTRGGGTERGGTGKAKYFYTHTPPPSPRTYCSCSSWPGRSTA